MSTENEIRIKVIVELEARPGKRGDLKSLLESVVAKYGASHPGFRDSTRYKVLDNPNILVEIAEWASAEVRATAMQKAMADGAYAHAGRVVSRAIQGYDHQATALMRSLKISNRSF